MNLSDLQNASGLARLNMSEKELEELLPAFQQMLSFFGIMQAAAREANQNLSVLDARGEELHATGLVSAGLYHSGTEHPESGGNMAESLLARAAERDGRFIVIPNVL